MLEPKFWRAIYDDTRDAFVVEQAGWHNGGPVIEYRFSLLADDDSDEKQGGLEKWWLVDDHLPEGEFYTFGHYADDAAFREDVERILAEAKQRAEQSNLDYFLAVTDIVKERAVEAGLEDDDIFEIEGLFEMGTEDAYSQRPFYDENRLHDHIERTKDECWRIHIGPVVDLAQKPLGWGVFVLLYPDLTSAATDHDIKTAARAQRLDLDHWHKELDARLAANAMIRFMLEGARMEEPDFAYMNDTEVFECTSVPCSVEKVLIPEWEVLEGDELKAFISGARPVVRELAHWHPHEMDMVSNFARQMGLQTNLADQLHARMLDLIQLNEAFDENSPWHYLDEDTDS